MKKLMNEEPFRQIVVIAIILLSFCLVLTHFETKRAIHISSSKFLQGYEYRILNTVETETGCPCAHTVQARVDNNWITILKDNECPY